MPNFAETELAVEVLAFRVRRRSHDERNVEALAEPLELADVLADDDDPFVRVPLQQLGNHVVLGRVLAGDAVFIAQFGDGIFHAHIIGQCRANLRAVGGRDPALRFQFSPGNVVFLRADQAEDVPLAAILANERGRQPEPATSLDLSRDAEHRGRQ